MKINARICHLHLTSSLKLNLASTFARIQYSDDPVLTRQVVCKTVGRLLLIFILENCKFRTTANTKSASGHQTICLLDVTKTLGNVALVKTLQSPTALPASVRNCDAVLCWVTQSCPTPCDPMNCSPPDSSIHRILQARILEWVVMLFSKGSSWPRDRTQVSQSAGGFFTVWATSEAQRHSKLEWNTWGVSKFHGTRVVKAEIGWSFVRDNFLISFQPRDFYGFRSPFTYHFINTY